MKRILLIVVAGLLFAGISLAQDNSAPASGSHQTPSATPSQQQMPEPSTAQPRSQQQAPEQTPPTQPNAEPPAANPPSAGQTGTAASQTNAPKIAPGSVIPAQLTKGVDAKKAKTGDEVVAKVTQDMKASSGQVLVPKDTRLVGHVTEAQPRSKEQKESQVGIAFDRAVMKNGTEMQLPMSIQAVIGPQNNANPGGGNEQAGPGYSPPAGNAGGGMAGGNRNPGMSGSNQAPPSPSATAGNGNEPSESQSGAAGRPPITGQTQGVVGISNLKLEPGSNPAQGSVLSSEKSNVKLDSGTLLLLRVNQPQ